MTKLIKGSETLNAIRQVFDTSEDIYAAVAYWNGGVGERIIELAGKNLHVVLDVNAGGTSASELSSLIKHLGKKVKVHPNLHTKIYASRDMAVVGSSNASRPGLHLVTTSRVEASVLVTDEAAESVFLYAKELFDGAEVANQTHVDICRKQFMRKPLAEAEAIEGKVDLLTALWERRDLLDEFPLLITYEEIDEASVTDEFNLARDELAGENTAGIELKQSQWTEFNWKLDKQYDDKLCISVHRRDGGGFLVALVRPVLTSSGEWTFARHQPWNTISFLDYRGQGFRKISGDHLSDFERAFDEIRDKEGMVRVKDLRLRNA